MHNISDIQLINFPLFNNEDSLLVVYEGHKKVPFFMNRVFMVKAHEKTRRGFHAHKECAQLLVVLSGLCRVICDDGSNKKEVTLDDPSKGLLIPPTLWAEQDYEANTILMVLTDKPYDASDYLRDYDEFLAFRKKI